MNRKFRKTARVLYRESFAFILTCSLAVLILPMLPNLALECLPYAPGAGTRLAVRALAGVVRAVLCCGYLAALLRLRKTGE